MGSLERVAQLPLTETGLAVYGLFDFERFFVEEESVMTVDDANTQPMGELDDTKPHAKEVLRRVFEDIAEKVFPPMDPFSVTLATLALACLQGTWGNQEWSKDHEGLSVSPLWERKMYATDGFISRMRMHNNVMFVDMEDKQRALVDFSLGFCDSFFRFVAAEIQYPIRCANTGDWSTYLHMLSVFKPYRDKNLVMVGDMEGEEVMTELFLVKDSFDELMGQGHFKGAEALLIMQEALLIGAFCLYYLEEHHTPKAIQL